MRTNHPRRGAHKGYDAMRRYRLVQNGLASMLPPKRCLKDAIAAAGL